MSPFTRRGLRASLMIAATLGCGQSWGQIAKGASKYLGNITTSNAVRSGYGTYWNQITPENETKWGVVEGGRDQMSWAGADRVETYAKQNNIPWKFHTLVWGSQYPGDPGSGGNKLTDGWLMKLSAADRKAEVIEWFDAVKAKYPDVPMIDVVNEAVTGHAPAPYKDALGGDGTTGHDWVIKSFQMARDRWPNSVLILNDYNNLRWNVDDFIAIAKKVVAADKGIIDAIGCQAHDLGKSENPDYNYGEMSAADLTAVLKKLHDQVGLPIFITELDLSYEDDTQQLNAYKSLFPVMWESKYVAGVTVWGYVFGKTWLQAKNSGLIKEDGTERPAMVWLKDYVKNNPNPPTDYPDLLKKINGTAGIETRTTLAASRPGMVVRNVDGRLVVGVERDGGFQAVSALGKH